MVLTHSSSLIDGPPILDQTYVQGDATTSLHDWLASYVAEGDDWSSDMPGTSWSYSNAGASLAGYLVETISGMNLQDYCAAHLFGPLGMTESSWFLKNLSPGAALAMPYEYQGGNFMPQGQYGFPDYPDGMLRTSATQLARYLVMFAQGGTYGGATLLQPSSVQEILKHQLASPNDFQGLLWEYGNDGSTAIFGHDGSYYGVSTDMWFDPATGAGYVLLTNGGTYFDDDDGSAPMKAMYAMNDKLLAIAEALP